jgi:predicted YcjX-like family ATPase
MIDDAVIKRGHSLYRRAINDCRAKLGMRYLQPGRFLCPGPRPDAPFLWFFPADRPPTSVRRLTGGALLDERFRAYQVEVRSSFFDTHFVKFARQVVLVDVLSALHAGREAYEDIERALADITACMDYGSPLRRMQSSDRAGRHALARMLPRTWANGIERLAIVATKADHVPSLQRDNLCNLVRSITDRGFSRSSFGRVPLSYHAAASVVSTRDATASYNGRAIEVVVGVPAGSERERPFYPGEVPSSRPKESFWGERYFELPVFIPPKIDPSGNAGVPHLEVDTVLVALLEDYL